MSGMQPEHGSKPNPDPTVATNAAVERAVKAERDYVDLKIGVLEQRLDGIDTATRLLNETVNRVPTDVTKEVTHLRELMEGSLQSIALQFRERDTRSERESTDNQIRVDAAFAAQKEAAKTQDENNSKSIDKSETATEEKITKLAELVGANTAGLADKIDDLKERVGRIESRKEGASDQRTETREGITTVQALFGIAAVLIAALAFYFARQNPEPVVIAPTPTVPANP